MSQLHEKSPKHCARQGFNYKKLLYALSTLLASIISLVLLIWFLLHPSKPVFYLKETYIYQLTLSYSSSAPQLLLLINCSIQVTLVSKNPNQKLGIYYDQLQLHAAYKGQQITTDTSLPPFYQGHQDTNLLTASLNSGSTGLPVVSSFASQAGLDQTSSGTLPLNLKVNGQIRWKVGTWVVPSHYHLNINCVALMDFPNVITGPLSLKKGTRCTY